MSPIFYVVGFLLAVVLVVRAFRRLCDACIELITYEPDEDYTWSTIGESAHNDNQKGKL